MSLDKKRRECDIRRSEELKNFYLVLVVDIRVDFLIEHLH
mgnify:CR=1 FL=1